MTGVGLLRLMAVAALAGGGVLGSGSGAAAASLYSGGGPRPGPSILYQPPAVSPQLTNTGTWSAPSILISGASAYRAGEYLYQDFLYDDHGADGGVRDPNDPRRSGDSFSMPNGTYTYPTGPGYKGNAADLVEFRVKPVPGATAFRVTLNTMVDPSLAAFTIGIGTTSSTVQPFPHGANTSGPADRFVTVHNTYADLITAGSLTATTLAPTVDTARRQIEVRVPTSAWDPGGGTVRLSVGVGLWDKATPAGLPGKYLLPAVSATSTSPGGAGFLSLGAPSAFFNVGFRHAEPGGQGNTDPNGNDRRWWRDEAQGQALKTGSISSFHDDVDFNKLTNGPDDDMIGQPQGVPQTGPMDRILSSHFETAQGTDYSTTCGNNAGCKGELRGQLQPYAVYVPPKPPPPKGYGLTLLLHSLGANYNQFLGSNNQSQFGDRGTGSLVITPSGRGPDGWYVEYAAADTFEAWADIASHYRLDAEYTAIAGYSMGGYGTYRFGTLYPDLFYKAQPTVGPPALGIWAPPAAPTGGDDSNTFNQLASMRNLPIEIWVMHADELVPFSGTEFDANQGFDKLGLRYAFKAHAPGEHLTLAINDQYQPAADWLGTGAVDRNPAHVTYVVNPHMAFPAVGLEADHAYWLSGARLANATGAAPRGAIDVRSQGFGVGDPVPGPTVFGAGVLTGGVIPAIGYDLQSKTWGPAPVTPVADRLVITGNNVSAVTVDLPRARVDCNVALDVTTDVPLTVTLPGCAGSAGGATRTFLPGAANLVGSGQLKLPNTAAAAGAPVRAALLLAVLGGALAVGVAALATHRRRRGQRA